MSGHAETHEGHGENQATIKSDSFLKKAGEKLIRWPGHGVFTLVGETFNNIGSAFVATSAYIKPLVNMAVQELSRIPEYASILAQNAGEVLKLSNLMTATSAITGAAGLIIGSYIGSQGIKHAKSAVEKAIFGGSKTALLGSYIFAPALVPVTAGISAASTLISMRHRR